jgi:hypothetical protein
VLARAVAGTARSSFEPVLQRLRELGMPGLVMSGDPHEGSLLGGHKAAPLPAVAACSSGAAGRPCSSRWPTARRAAPPAGCRPPWPPRRAAVTVVLVTVAGPSGRHDLVVPADVPVGDLLGAISAAAGAGETSHTDRGQTVQQQVG